MRPKKYISARECSSAAIIQKKKIKMIHDTPHEKVDNNDMMFVVIVVAVFLSLLFWLAFGCCGIMNYDRSIYIIINNRLRSMHA